MHRNTTVVVGGGAAGCIIAARLANAGIPVILFEKRKYPERIADKRISMPASRVYFRTLNAKSPTKVRTTPQTFCGNRGLAFKTGNFLSGTGEATRELSYVQPLIEEVHDWLSGISSRGYCQHVLESFEGDVAESEESIPRFAYEEETFHVPCSSEFIKSSVMESFETSSVIRVPESSQGVILTPKKFIHQKSGTVLSPFTEYLVPAQEEQRFRKMLSIKCCTEVQSIELDSTNSVKSVCFKDENGHKESASCSRVILCAGAIESPRILLASGIGAPSDTAAFGVPCRIPLKEVGKNLHDQVEYSVHITTKQPMSSATMFHPFVKKLIEAEWGVFGTGWGKYSFEGPRIYGRSPAAQTSLKGIPDYGVFMRHYLDEADISSHGCTLDARILKPSSRGAIMFPQSHAREILIDPQYLSHSKDRIIITHAVDRVLALCRQSPLDDVIKSVNIPREVDLNLRATGCGDFGGTCSVGTVLSPKLQVDNTENLFVCDSSAIPVPVSSGISSTVMLMAHVFVNHLINQD